MEFWFKVYFSTWYSLSFFVLVFLWKNRKNKEPNKKEKNFSSQKTVKSLQTIQSSFNHERGFKRNQADSEFSGTVVTINHVTKVT